MTLAILWFFVIAVLWIGFFILEGFDFGVGMLHAFVGKDDMEKRVAINTIGPVWDGNEVWLVTAGAGIFAAFPLWYATMFSTFYLPLVIVLIGLIVRGVAIEFRGRREATRWRSTWSGLLIVGSLLVPLLLGCALANLLHGLPIDRFGEYRGTFWQLLHPYCLLAGVTVTLLCVVQGSTYLALKTAGEIRERSRRIGLRVTPLAVLLLAGFAIWTWFGLNATIGSIVAGTIALLGVGWSWAYTQSGRDGWAFVLSTVGIGATILSLFLDLYPDVMVSSTSRAYSLTVENASSSPHTLMVMSIVTLIFLPIVLLYQGWTFYVFRQRLTGGRAGGGDEGGGEVLRPEAGIGEDPGPGAAGMAAAGAAAED